MCLSMYINMNHEYLAHCVILCELTCTVFLYTLYLSPIPTRTFSLPQVSLNLQQIKKLAGQATHHMGWLLLELTISVSWMIAAAHDTEERFH
jgi:hypothetical protein